ncbi:hypothetical protein GCM10011393_03450 [Sphingopyxis bauzanensis]|nr:hypothetical protein GCM10011393_03450 [Sphingopyxis bauzanensis]
MHGYPTLDHAGLEFSDRYPWLGEAEPAIIPAVLTDSNAAAEYDSAIEAWGDWGCAAVARI